MQNEHIPCPDMSPKNLSKMGVAMAMVGRLHLCPVTLLSWPCRVVAALWQCSQHGSSFHVVTFRRINCVWFQFIWRQPTAKMIADICTFAFDGSVYKDDRTRKEAITSKIKHAIKLKTSPARLAQLLQPSLAFCFSLQPMTAYCPVRRHWLQAKTKR